MKRLAGVPLLKESIVKRDTFMCCMNAVSVDIVLPDGKKKKNSTRISQKTKIAKIIQDEKFSMDKM
jgi:hypothetical protein